MPSMQQKKTQWDAKHIPIHPLKVATRVRIPLGLRKRPGQRVLKVRGSKYEGTLGHILGTE
jgi:hypothetical protein